MWYWSSLYQLLVLITWYYFIRQGCFTLSQNREDHSKENPRLFMSNFLPFECQMETGRVISISLLLQQPLFSLDFQLPLEAVYCHHWRRPFLSWFSRIRTSCWLTPPSLWQSSCLPWIPIYLFTIQQNFGNLIFPRKRHYFGNFISPCLSDYRRVVFIKGGCT